MQVNADFSVRNGVDPSEQIKKFKLQSTFQFTFSGLKMNPSGKVKINHIPLDLVTVNQGRGVQVST